MSTPSGASSSRWKSGISILMTTIVSAALAAIGTYYATKYANFATSENDQAMRYIDFQATRENNVTSFFRIPGVMLSFKDNKGNPLKALSLVKIDLQNFSGRDISDVDLQLDAAGNDNLAPTLQTFRVGNGPAEDCDAENGVKQTTKGSALSIFVHLKSVNRTETFAPTRTILLYFKGETAPNLVVSTNAAGVTARPFEYQHYLDTQSTHQSFFRIYGEQITFVLFSSLWVIVSSWLIWYGRRREIENMSHSVEIVEKMLQSLQIQRASSGTQNDVAKSMVLEMWQSAYERAWRVSRWLSVTPDKTKL